MANTPAQLPNIDLPGAEYFSLAPNRTVALSGRNRRRFASASTTVPASANGFELDLVGQIESPFVDTQGIYVHKFDCFAAPASGGLVLESSLGGLNRRSTSTNFADYPLGYLAITTPNLFIGTVILTDREILVTGRDISFQTGLQTNVLNVSFTLIVNNTLSSPVNLVTVIQIVYTKLDGFVE